MLDFLDNKTIQGSGHLALAYSKVVLDKDLPGAYNDFTTALALFKTSDIVPLIQRVLVDVDSKVKNFDMVKDEQKVK